MSGYGSGTHTLYVFVAHKSTAPRGPKHLCGSVSTVSSSLPRKRSELHLRSTGTGSWSVWRGSKDGTSVESSAFVAVAPRCGWERDLNGRDLVVAFCVGVMLSQVKTA